MVRSSFVQSPIVCCRRTQGRYRTRRWTISLNWCATHWERRRNRPSAAQLENKRLLQTSRRWCFLHEAAACRRYTIRASGYYYSRLTKSISERRRRFVRQFRSDWSLSRKIETTLQPCTSFFLTSKVIERQIQCTLNSSNKRLSTKVT